MERSPARSSRSLKTVPGTSSAYAERVIGGYYLDITPNRDSLARYGLMVGDVQDVIATALGGDAVTTTVEGRERYTVNVRYPRDLRSNPQAIASDVLVPLPRAAPCRWARSLGQADARPHHHPHRERPACGLHLRRYPRPRPRRLRRRGAKGGRRQRAVPARLLRHLERSVRIPPTRRSAAQGGRAGDAADHLPAALSQFPHARPRP